MSKKAPDNEQSTTESRQEQPAEQAEQNSTPETDAYAEVAKEGSAEGEGSQDSQGSQGSQDSQDDNFAKLAVAQAEAAQAKDDLLRVQAEMQNLRRRTEQDIEKAHKYGNERFATELLSVMDNLERALTAASDNDDPTVKAIYDGVDLTLKSFADAFRKFNIEPVDPQGEPFDPQLHQAMSLQENAEVEPNTVIAVMQKGYTLHGRVIRPAMVMVSKAPSGGESS